MANALVVAVPHGLDELQKVSLRFRGCESRARGHHELEQVRVTVLQDDKRRLGAVLDWPFLRDDVGVALDAPQSRDFYICVSVIP